MNILIIEDDKTINLNLAQALQSEGINVTVYYDGMLAERALQRDIFDCIVMDVNLPGKNGFELCRDFRKINSVTPVLMLTAFSELEDKIEGFNCGADDYLTKPFFMRELLVRIKTLVKRKMSVPPQGEHLIVDDLKIELRSKIVSRQDQKIDLTPREYQILFMLVKRRGEIISKKDLVREIWGNVPDANTNTIEVYINFLRKKIDKPFGKQNIKTKVGYGYYFE